MPLSGKVLEDSIRLDRIRRIKRALYAVQVVMLVAVGFSVMIYFGGSQLKPFYLPLDSFTAIMVLLLLVICVEGFFFRILEIRFARSSSARHLMAKNSLKRAVFIAVVTGILAGVLLVPGVIGAIEDATETKKMLLPGGSLDLWTSDPLAIQRTVQMKVSAAEEVHVYLVDDVSFNLYEGNMSALYLHKINDETYAVPAGGEVVADLPRKTHALYHLVLNDMYNPGTSATVVLVKEASETFTGIVGILLVSFAIANVAWAFYLVPIERKYAEGSIYK